MGIFLDTINRLFPPQAAIPELTGLELREEIDVRGFDMGIFVDLANQQGTVNFGLPDPKRRIREQDWQAWEDKIARTPQMLATATIDEAGELAASPRIATTFKAVGKEQKKNIDQLVTDVSVRQADLYDQADALGLSARPRNAAEVGEAVYRGLAGAVGQWGDVDNISISHRLESLLIDEHRYVTTYYVNTSAPMVADQLDAVMSAWEGEDTIRRTRVFRPYVLPEDLDQELATGFGRRWSLVTISGANGADQGFQEAMDQYPVIGLNVRRLYGRQRTAVLEGLGIGVWGWQHLGKAQRKDLA